VPVMGAIALSAGVLQRERLLNFAATFQAAGEKAETGNLSAGEIQGVVTRGRFPHQWSQLSIRTEQSPQADSRITLLDETDALGMPRVALDWRIAEDDDIQLHRALTLLGRELGAADIARLWIPGDGKKIVLRPSPGGHHMGTTRMGLDPASSVVNADCRTHDINNLFIAGSSVFPTGGEANPTLTIVALAHRLAATLKKAQ
jgi:choline dehydrogenase-like flavoprotein